MDTFIFIKLIKNLNAGCLRKSEVCLYSKELQNDFDLEIVDYSPYPEIESFKNSTGVILQKLINYNFVGSAVCGNSEQYIDCNGKKYLKISILKSFAYINHNYPIFKPLSKLQSSLDKYNIPLRIIRYKTGVGLELIENTKHFEAIKKCLMK